MDTNFRLLRAEIFSAIQRGIQDLKSGTLNHRDMNCYFNVTLTGYYFTHSQFCLALKVVIIAKKVLLLKLNLLGRVLLYVGII
jgi:hypothetical protein